MAEGLLRQIGGERFEVASAGASPSAVHPLAVEAMRERGIDISRHSSQSVEEYSDQAFDFVVTVCDRAAESCPVLPGEGQRLHAGFPDPAAADGSDAERLAAFREARAAIEAWLRDWISDLARE